MSPFRIPLGAQVSDEITHFNGIVVGRTEYITGSNIYMVQPLVMDAGKYPEPHWFDEERLAVVKTNAVMLPGDPGWVHEPPY